MKLACFYVATAGRRLPRSAATAGLALLLLALIAWPLSGCRSAKPAPDATGSQDTETAPESTPPAGSATKTEPPPPEESAPAGEEPTTTGPAGQPPGPPPEAVSPVDASDVIRDDWTVRQNLAAMQAMRQRVLEKYSTLDFPPGDSRRESDETVRKLLAAQRRLIDLYLDKELQPEEHYMLCKELSRYGAAFQDATAIHCEAYLATQPADGSSPNYRIALVTAIEAHFQAGNDERAEAACRKYLETFCNLEKDAGAARTQPGCRKILTHYLPNIYHRTGDVDALERVRDECWAYRFERAHDLLTINGFLLQDLWKNGNLARLEKIAREIVSKNVWSENTSRTEQDLVAPALSSLSRIQLLENCYAARQVYLDYDFDYPDIEQTWRQDNIRAPTTLLCREAPPLDVEKWIPGDAPAVQPGRASGGKFILLHFVDAASPAAMNTLAEVDMLARENPEKLQVIGLVPRSDRLFDPGRKSTLSDLDADRFQAGVARVARDLDLSFPLAFTPGGAVDTNLTAYRVQRFPTMVLVGPDGTVVAYHTLPTVDAGWTYLIEELSGKP